MAESDDDIWEYKSLKRVKRSESNSSQNSPRKPPPKKPRSRRSAELSTKGRGRGRSKNHGALSQNHNSQQRVKLANNVSVKSEENTTNASHVLPGSSRVQKGYDENESKRPLSQMKLDCFSPSTSRTNVSQLISKATKNKTNMDKKGSKRQAKQSYKVKDAKKKKSSRNKSSVKIKEVKKVWLGYCPSCQMPFSTLGPDSPERHVTECLSNPLTAEDECSHGLACDVTLENHYRKFTHHKLAEARTRLPTEARSDMSQRQDMKTEKPEIALNVQSSESPFALMKSSNQSCIAADNTSLRTSLRDMTAKITEANENLVTEQISNTVGRELSTVVSSEEGRRNHTRTRKSNMRVVEDNLRTPGKESTCRLVSSEESSLPEDDNINESCFLASDGDIFDTRSSPIQSDSCLQKMHQGVYNPQFAETENDDMQSSLLSEISTSILAGPGPTCQEPQQLNHEVPKALSTQIPVLHVPVQLGRHDLNSSPSTRNHAHEPLPTSCRNNIQTSQSTGLVSKGHRQAQNMNLDFDRCSQVDINIKVTSRGKSQDEKQQSGEMCGTQSFFQMKARKARHIQVIVEENQDSESTNSDLEDSSANSTLSQPLSETNMKQPYALESRESACVVKQSDSCWNDQENNSDCFMQKDFLGTSNTDNHFVDAVRSTPHSVQSTNTSCNECASANRQVIKEEPVGNTNESSSQQQGTLSRLVPPFADALDAVPSNFLKQSTLSSYFGWGSVKKEKMYQELQNDRQYHPSKHPASQTTIGQNRFTQNKVLNSDLTNKVVQRSSSQGSFSGQHSEGKSSRWQQGKVSQGDDGGQTQGQDAGRSHRQCPFYRKIQGTSFVVDAFRYGDIPGCNAYFLSHFHYDHYSGLTRHFQHHVYCSKITANLVRTRIKVAAKFLRPLPMNEACIVNGVEVTLLEANHCPGAVLFLFRLNDGRVFLHTGDFRADPAMEELSQLRHCRVDQLFLDTTYLDPQYDFPTQSEVMEYSARVAVDAVKRNDKTLLVCGTYTIGKEKIFIAIAEALGCKVFVAKDKKNILDCLEDNHLQSILTLDKTASRLHVVTMATLSHQSLKQYLSTFSGRYDAVVAFKPTGWTHSVKRTSLEDIKPTKSGPVSIYGVPYSEHSSYSELRRFVMFIRPNRIIPTVNVGSAKSRDAMNKHFKAWLSKGQSTTQKTVGNSSILNWVN